MKHSRDESKVTE